MKKAPACDPAPAPAPGRGRSHYVEGIVIMLCLIALALGFYFTTTDGTRPTSTAATTAATPAPIETTSSTTTKIPDIPGRIVCFTEVITQAIDPLNKICTDVVIFLTFDEHGETTQSLTFVENLNKTFPDKLLIGMKFEENKKLQFFDAVGKSTAWNLIHSHALTEVDLKDQNAQKVQNAARKLKEIEIISLLVTSEMNATIQTLPLIKGLKVITVKPECDAQPWNEAKVLALANAIKSTVGKAIAISFTAALWKTGEEDNKPKKKCDKWKDGISGLKECMQDGQPYEQCKQEGMVLVDNATIRTLVTYAKSRSINAFTIRRAEILVETLFLNRSFHLLNFTLTSQGVPAKYTPQRGIQQRQPGADDWGSDESGGKTVTATSSAEPETKQVETEVTVVAAEHHAKSGVAKKASSKPADSATNIPASSWRNGSSSSPTAGTEDSKKSPREETKNPIKQASTPSSDMATSAPSSNDEEAVLTT